jgi:hypothetical protein
MSGASGLRPHDHGSLGAGGSLSTTSAFANPMTTQDDVIVGGASGVATRLAKGTDGQVLTVDPSTHHLVWATPSAGMTNPMTTLNDIIVGGASGTPARLAKGTDSQVLRVDPTSHNLAWATPSVPYQTWNGTDTINLASGVTSINRSNNGAGVYFGLGTSGDGVDLSSNDYVSLGANNYAAGGASTAKHTLFGGHGLVLPLLTSDPSGGNSEKGQMYFNSSTNKFRGYNGSAWVDLA